MLSRCAAGVVVLAAVACGGDDEAPRQAQAQTQAPAAAEALAKTFATELVGDVTPFAPIAGDYAMALAMSFEMFVTTELRIVEDLKGVLRLSLASDGTAQACAGAIRHHVSAGQYHYEPDPAKRKHHASNDSRLIALAGAWQVVDGVAVIQLDRSAFATCDASKATATTGTPPTELRCIGVTGGRVPAGSLLCEASERNQLELGMPMTGAGRTGPTHDAPSGRSFVLGVPGVVVDVSQDSEETRPSITFRTGAAPLVESDYVRPKR